MSSKNSILVIDDEKDFTDLIGEILEKYHFKVDKVNEGLTGLDFIQQNSYDAVILDLIMPDINGLEILNRIKKNNSDLPVIILSGDGRSDTLKQSLKSGAYDFLTKPLEWEKLAAVVNNAILLKQLTKRVDNLEDQLDDKYKITNIVGNSSKMQEIIRNLRKIINNDVTVYIQGESGTGKELLAKTIHFNSHRRNKPFIAVNCTSIPDTLLDEELFGSMNTESRARKYGKCEQAQGGTLYLDDLAEFSPVAQVKILKILQESKFTPVGSRDSHPIDVRIIAGTNKDIQDKVRKGTFREDLFFMIHIFPLYLPPLRQRIEDIPTLVSNIIEKHNFKNNVIIRRISDEAMDYLINYHWPGNIRELENVIERAMLLVEDNTILPQHLPISIISHGDITVNGGTYMDLKQAVSLSNKIVPLDKVEEEVLRQALKLNNYNMSNTATKLGIGRTTLYRKLAKYDIKLDR